MPTAVMRVLALTLLLLLTSLSAGGEASTPPASEPVDVPSTPGQTITRTWEGVVPPTTTGSGSSNCTDPQRLPNEIDHHTVRINAPDYSLVDVEYRFIIEWEPNVDSSTSDEVLTVINKDVVEAGGGEQEGNESAEVGSSDGGQPKEEVVGTNLKSATYDALACGFINPAPQAYTGRRRRQRAVAAAAEPDLAARGLAPAASSTSPTAVLARSPTSSRLAPRTTAGRCSRHPCRTRSRVSTANGRSFSTTKPCCSTTTSRFRAKSWCRSR